ncbi:MAG TPA: FAD:protein FMN transferase [Lysobacter sp.]|nr:FAD:protein FMN transferase [Lysobacter sp.]
MRTVPALAGAALAWLLLALVTAVMPAKAAVAPLQQLSGQTMGTTWSVTLQATPEAMPALQQGVQAQLDTVVAQMSTWEVDSDLSRFNRSPAGSRHRLPTQFHEVMTAALQLAAGTDGAFDPTVGPLVNLWGFGPDGPRDQAPAPAELATARARVGWQRLQLDDTGHLTQPGDAYLDLSGIAKGYGVDRVADFLVKQGIPAFLIEVGGELRSHGRKPDGSAWRIAVERPLPDDLGGNAGQQDAISKNQNDDTPVVVALDGLAMATSGDYRHYFEQDARRYSHTIDPRTGQPVQHRLASVTVLHEQCMQADALATALTVLGPEEGWAYALHHQLAVLLVWHDGDGFTSRMTPAFRARLQQ